MTKAARGGGISAYGSVHQTSKKMYRSSLYLTPAEVEESKDRDGAGLACDHFKSPNQITRQLECTDVKKERSGSRSPVFCLFLEAP